MNRKQSNSSYLKLFSLSLFILITQNGMAQWGSDLYPTDTLIDVKHYEFIIDIEKDSDLIRGKATIQLHLFKERNSLQFDLVEKNGKTGMKVDSIKIDGELSDFRHVNEKVIIGTNEPLNNQVEVEIWYAGIPADGLTIDKNKFGKRTYFADHWPNRAHHWLPCIDHPYEKAAVDFLVTAPAEYKVIANGFKVSEEITSSGKKQTHWKQLVPIPMKVTVIGVADLAVSYYATVKGTPVSAWVFQENKEWGFEDYSYAPEVLRAFDSLIAHFPYAKLANVQSKTIYGGMENASAIFYNENTVNGLKNKEALIAHEVAHQWFGNSVTEYNWHHLWLSEGFATYLTQIYMENKYGEERLAERMVADRNTVITFSKQRYTPIVDYDELDVKKLLNRNVYQKASWVLHMLRERVGDDAFFSGLRQYYQQYEGAHAFTSDFRKCIENSSGENLEDFFQQWYFQAGHPVLNYKIIKTSGKKLKIELSQSQDNLFLFPLDIEIETSEGRTTHRIEITNRTQAFTLPLKGDFISLKLDPNVKLLYEKG